MKTDSLGQYWSVLYRMILFWNLSDAFLRMRLESRFEEGAHRAPATLLLLRIRDTGQQSDSWVMVWTLIHWLKWCLPEFSTLKPLPSLCCYSTLSERRGLCSSYLKRTKSFTLHALHEKVSTSVIWTSSQEISVCVYVCVICVCMNEYRGQRLMLGKVTLHHIFSDRISHWTYSSPNQLSRLTNEPKGCSCLYLLLPPHLNPIPPPVHPLNTGVTDVCPQFQVVNIRT